MDVSVGYRGRRFPESLVAGGRYESESDIVDEDFRLVEEREAKLQALRDEISAAAAAGGAATDADLEEIAAKLGAKGKR